MDGDHPVARQAVVRADDAESAVRVLGKTAAERADPKRTGAIGHDGADLIAAQAILSPVVPEPARGVLEEAGAVRANPQTACGVLIDHLDFGGRNPVGRRSRSAVSEGHKLLAGRDPDLSAGILDRKSTRLNSSHLVIS